MLDWIVTAFDRLLWRWKRRREERMEERTRIMIEFWRDPNEFMRKFK